MYDPKFEKAIQQKMEELEFRPPESVWVNIEKAVVVKRRRRTGYVWRYLLPGALVAAAAGMYFWHYAGVPAGVSRTTPAVAVDAKTSAGNGGIGNSPSTANGDAATTRPMTAQGDDATAITAQAAGATSDKGGTAAGGQPSANGNMSTRGNRPAGGNAPTNELTSTNEYVSASELTSAGEYATVDGHASTAGAAGQKGLAAWFYQPGLADPRLTPQVQGAALNTKKSNLASLAKLSHPQRRWEAGFIAGGGLSSLNRLNSDQAKAALTSTVTSLYALAGAASNKTYISNTRPEASFDGGIYLQRALSDRWIVNTGMNLHYYSNRISVGQQLTTYVQASASYFIPTTSAAARNSSMYSAGNTRSFTNKYYFLELPAGLQWKLSKNHLFPVFVEGGVSLSRLMGASALFYDAKTGLYSKDGDVVNKTQINVSSALLVGLPIRSVAIQLGPEIQYGLTPMVNTQGLGDQHFLYTGMRMVVIPGRR